MVKIVTIFNRKGGTGKTSTAVSLAHGLALAGKRVLLIDCDPQGNVAVWLNLDQKHSLYHLFMADVSPEECIISTRKNLDVIIGNESLIAADQALVGEMGREKILSEKLSGVSDKYDFILMDCPPSLSVVSLNALMYCNEVYIPISMEYLALVGVKKILDNLEQIRKRLDKKIEVGLVIPTLYDQRNNISGEILETLKQKFLDKVTDPIRVNVRIKEAPSHKKTIFEYASNSTGALDYQKLTDRVLGL